ncbi:uncharacterized protein TNIN_105901 [Trichonephila inaurata madagascariensis]|uniref:Uncharacterized protein n=1 Tax=Trichonephila inaurata madagascariensis TaxID=2747483 RepID=A0A8X6XZ11_9ARAC|nr:uncharacterized protein TNIN_105901 [Trichonephila inaurata madagascariensis]
MTEIFRCVTPLLTLESINNSEDEMIYITKMRNVMESQNENEEHNEYLRGNAFIQTILCLVRNRSILEICLSHTLTKVVESHVLVHKDIPFRHWRTINIDNDGFPEYQNSVQNGRRIASRVDNYAAAEQFLVATFINSHRYYLFEGWFNWFIYPLNLFTHETLDSIQINDPLVIVNSSHHTWRRVYEDNWTLFSCAQDDIDAYVKEQTHGQRHANVFKQLMSRAMGESFNQFSLLKSLASPYYYELPHQDEQEYETFTTDPNWCSNRCSTPYMIFSFESSLNLVIKNTA